MKWNKMSFIGHIITSIKRSLLTTTAVAYCFWLSRVVVRENSCLFLSYWWSPARVAATLTLRDENSIFNQGK